MKRSVIKSGAIVALAFPLASFASDALTDWHSTQEDQAYSAGFEYSDRVSGSLSSEDLTVTNRYSPNKKVNYSDISNYSDVILAQAAAESAAAAMDTVEDATEGDDAPPDISNMSVHQIGELLANPFSFLWFGMIQNDTIWYEGDLLDLLDEDDKVMNSTLIQPVMSVQFSEDSRLIFRPVIPIHSYDTVQNIDLVDDEIEGPILTSDWDRKTGLGDIVLWTAYSPQYKPPLVWGFGPTIMMNTATNDALGTGKWSAGPMATGVYLTDKWIAGGVAQHWWSFAGDSDRDHVNLTDIQPIIRYRLSPSTNIGMAPNIRYNWSGNSGNKLQFPIGIGGSTVVKLGALPMGVGAEFYYYVEKNDDFGPDYQIRVFVSPVLPSPDWSRVPIFGG